MTRVPWRWEVSRGRGLSSWNTAGGASESPWEREAQKRGKREEHLLAEVRGYTQSRKKVVKYKRSRGQKGVPQVPGIWMETSKGQQRVAVTAPVEAALRRLPLSHSCSSRPTWIPLCMRSLPTQGSTALLKKRPRAGLHRLCILSPLHGHETPLTASEPVPREEAENTGVCVLHVWDFHTKTRVWICSTLWLYIELYILFWVRMGWTQNACLWFHMQ